MRIAFFTDNYLSPRSSLDPFRTELAKELIKRSSEFLLLQSNDYLYPTGEFFLDGDRKRVLDELARFHPDLVVSLNRSGLTPDLLSVISCPIVSWYIDNPHRFPPLLRGRAPNERIFVASRSTHILEWMRRDLKDPCFTFEYLPFCANLDVFHPSPARKADSEMCDVSFVGTLWDPQALINKISSAVKNEDQLKALQFGYNRYLKDYDFDLGEYFAHSINFEWNASDMKSVFDDFISTQHRLSVLEAVSDLKLEVYGNAVWLGQGLLRNPNLLKAYRTLNISAPKDLANLYRRTRVGLSVAHHQAQCGFPWRIMDLLATGVPLVTDRHSELDDLFKDGETFLSYGSPEEASDQVRRVLGDVDLQRRLSENGIASIREKHTFVNRVNELTDFAEHRDCRSLVLCSENLSSEFLKEIVPACGVAIRGMEMHEFKGSVSMGGTVLAMEVISSASIFSKATNKIRQPVARIAKLFLLCARMIVRIAAERSPHGRREAARSCLRALSRALTRVSEVVGQLNGELTSLLSK